MRSANRECPVARSMRELHMMLPMAALGRLAIQLDERHLDLRMPGRGHALAGAEDAVDVVDAAPGDAQEPIVAGSAPMRYGRLAQVPGAVELVTVREVRPSPTRL